MKKLFFKSIFALILGTSVWAYAKTGENPNGSSNVEVYSALLNRCDSVSTDKAETCKLEAREAAIQIRVTGTPTNCRKLRDSSSGSSAYYDCLRTFAGTPVQCRQLRDSSNGGAAYTNCLKTFVGTPSQCRQLRDSASGSSQCRLCLEQFDALNSEVSVTGAAR